MTAGATVAEQTNSDPLATQAVALSLTAKDLLTSVAWYRDVLGFTVDYVNERDGKPSSAGIRSGAARIFLNQDDGAKGWERTKGEGFAITFVTAQDVDAFAARIKSKGGTLVMEPADMPWGVRMMRLHDPDGFRLAIWKPLGA
jgi:uncharacterized glyoxalase superfamily protein PhnB